VTGYAAPYNAVGQYWLLATKI